MSVYYVIASIKNMENHFAVKMLETSNDLTHKSKEVKFSIDDSKLIYLGKKNENFQVFDDVLYEKLRFFLSRYKTKINKDIYKIDLMDLLGRICYGNETIYLDESVDISTLNKATDLEKIRLTKFNNFVELESEKRKKILKKFNQLERKWLDYWKDVKVRLMAFYRKHPKPLKRNYYRSGVSAIFFGKFKDDDYRYESVDHYKKLEWLCSKLAEESEKLSIDFDAKCPNDCEEKVNFFVNFEDKSDGNELYYLDEDVFPHAVYKRLYLLHGCCSECGLFHITYGDNDDDENFTIIFNNTLPEFIFYHIQKIIHQRIAMSIEKELYGDYE